MKTRFSQQGISMLSWMTILFVVSFFVTCAVKLLPLYIDSFTVGTAVENVVERQRQKTQSPTEIRKAIERQFISNRVEAIRTKDIKITRKQGKVIINANYEKRVPLFYNIDAVVKFDKFNYEIMPNGRDD